MARISAESKERQRIYNRAYMERWRASPEGKAYIKMYREKLRSPEGKRKRAEQAKRYYSSPIGKRYKEIFRLRAYGITPELYAEMLQAQQGGCKLCNGPARGMGKFHVDHDHDTGRVRGLLCTGCNAALGLFRDDPALLERAAVYIRENKDA